MRGTLYGLGVGPGDPDLITIKAYKILQRVPVIAYPAPEKGDSLARKIAAPHLPGTQTEIVIRTPMNPGSFPAHDIYDKYSAEIEVHLSNGLDVAILCEGDPFIYGSFMYLFTRFIKNIHSKPRVRVIPGVSSIVSCAAAAGTPLVSRNQVLTIIPATLPESDLKSYIMTSDSIAIMKVGRYVAKVKRVIKEVGYLKCSWYVEYASMERQLTMRLVDYKRREAPYFSMILIRQPDWELEV